MSNYWEQVELDGLREEAKQSGDTERLRELAGSHHELAQAVATNPKTPLSLLVELTQHEQEAVKLSLLRNPELPTQCFESLANNPPRGRLRALAACARTPPEILRRIATGGTANAKVLVLIAENPGTPPDVLESLSDHWLTAVFSAAQKNPKNPLYVSGTPQQRWSRSRRPTLPDDLRTAPNLIVEQMIQSEYVRDRDNIAMFGNLNEDQLLRLAKDTSDRVRMVIARERALTEEALTALRADRTPSTLASLTNNARIPIEQRLEILAAMLSGEAGARELAAQSALLTQEQLESLSSDSSEPVRVALAMNRLISRDLVERLADDSSSEVRRIAALNINATPELRERVARATPAPIPLLTEPFGPFREAAPPSVQAPPQSSPAPSALNTNALGAALLFIGVGFLLLFSIHPKEGFYLAAMTASIFLAVMLFSVDKNEKAAKIRGLSGFIFLFGGLLLLPLSLALHAPFWVVLFAVYLLLIGCFLLVTMSTSIHT